VAVAFSVSAVHGGLGDTDQRVPMGMGGWKVRLT